MRALGYKINFISPKIGKLKRVFYIAMGLSMDLLIFCNYNLIVQIGSALFYFALRYSMSVCEKLTET